MTSRSGVLAGLAVVIAMLSTTSPARAADTLTADFAGKAVLKGGGEAISLSIEASCPAGADVLEAFVYVTTREGSTSSFAPLPLVCDGDVRNYVVEVQALEAPFEKGKVRASGYVLLDTGQSVSPTEIIHVKRR